MPQWSRDEHRARQKFPDERWQARCPRASATQLLAYDHHVVWIGGRAALLRTYQWAAEPIDTWPDDLPLEVSFTYASGHPTAPDHIRQLVAALEFTLVEASTERANEHAVLRRPRGRYRPGSRKDRDRHGPAAPEPGDRCSGGESDDGDDTQRT